MLASIVHVPELELDKEEAGKLANAIEKVSRHYPVNIAPKAVDWANLGICAVTIYGTRIAAYRFRLKAEGATGNVAPFQVVQS